MSNPAPMTPGVASTRTGTQASFAGTVIGLLLIFDLVSWTPEQALALGLALTTVTSYVQNVVENRLGWGFLRAVPSEPKPKPRPRRRKAKRATS